MSLFEDIFSNRPLMDDTQASRDLASTIAMGASFVLPFPLSMFLALALCHDPKAAIGGMETSEGESFTSALAAKAESIL